MGNHPNLHLPLLLGALGFSSLLAASWELLVWTLLLPLSSLVKRPQKVCWMKMWVGDTVNTRSARDSESGMLLKFKPLFFETEPSESAAQNYFLLGSSHMIKPFSHSSTTVLS